MRDRCHAKGAFSLAKVVRAVYQTFAMETARETRAFGAESAELLKLVIHSVYSNKEIFLRELISNASDALDKRRFMALQAPELMPEGTELGITLSVDKSARTLTVTDNGVGMSRDEVVSHIGTIAKSGTKELLQSLAGRQDAPQLIGQFGVGFYSAFMVADRVELVTRKLGEKTAVRWESTGDGSYTIEPAERDSEGTSVTLHLKPADKDNALLDFSDAEVLAEVVRKHSDFVGYPVRLGDRTINSMKPIWTRPQSEVSEREYAEFYRHISHDFGTPLKSIRMSAEGTFEYQALLFIPENAPFDLYFRENKRGLQLYVRRVLIIEQCEELLPSYLRFVRGVVDAADLPLNVSRELLQHTHQLTQIRKRLAKKVIDALGQLLEQDRATYEKFFGQFGPLLKEGVASDADNKDKLAALLLYASSESDGKLVSLAEAKRRMKEGQEALYYISGDSREAVARSPHLEAHRQKGYEVLFFSEPVDELVAATLEAFDGTPLKSVSKGACDLKADQPKTDTGALGDLCEHLQRALDAHVKEVRVSERLVTSPACLVAGENDLSPHMERILRQTQRDVPAQKRILEINPAHAEIRALDKRLRERRDDTLLKTYAEVLFAQALLAEGSPLPDPSAFAAVLADLVLRAENV